MRARVKKLPLVMVETSIPRARARRTIPKKSGCIRGSPSPCSSRCSTSGSWSSSASKVAEGRSL